MITKVTLRQKNISKGRKSLYLDFYPPIPHPKTGKPTRREFLGLNVIMSKKEIKAEIEAAQLLIDKHKDEGKKTEKQQVQLKAKNDFAKQFKGLTPINKVHNTETLQIAESIRQKRENFLNKPEIYSQYEKEQLRIKEMGELCFVAYFKKIAHKKTGSNRSNWVSTLKYLDTYTNGHVQFADLNQSFFNDFKEYLLTTKSNKSNKTTLSQNSAASYFNKIKDALKQAQKEKIITTDLNSEIDPIKELETRREYLTLDELNQLVKTPCNNPIMKQAALFSALTGMAHKELTLLTWGDISQNDNKEYLILSRRSKTGRDNYLPISEQAYNLLGTPEAPENKVFDGFKYSAYQNKHLFQWIGAAGITKDITFHCFRHTYATLQLTAGTAITTVSKMLGHKDLKTTLIYAKIVDEAKREATNKITLDL